MKPTGGFGASFNPQHYSSGHEHSYDATDIVDIMSNEAMYYGWLRYLGENYKKKQRKGMFNEALALKGIGNITDDFGVRLGIPTAPRREADKIFLADFIAQRGVFGE